MVADPVLVMWLEYMVEWVEGDVKNHRYGVSSSCRRKGSFVVRHRNGPSWKEKEEAGGKEQRRQSDHSTQPKLGWLMGVCVAICTVPRCSKPLDSSISSVAPIPNRWVGWRDRELLNSHPGG
ncbi:hypothetical protein MCOR02_006274 [Pyricularia oryzae]|uniref:Uncharacterized protein n=2 Tax=Pyricularia oryzae TaxID=318829 RepID=A0AA97P8L1_PYRO3|nr:hypothetical protein OOU_Y34scaffold00126g89 [Pyricularia oryzae Y34]KAH9434256.1 hypothetical protein MCOR02_006274 [Pyricularia oryzae]KAI6307139.1 hypothetical protein MCOR29_009809 [Pyricularia oryzae]KAI6343125.1 hypothetical protein MCOR30_001567 [Pyricularia oryzae]KAI6367309.1 hypothetical protein MCOR32_007212 [Pyricularia oryzae]